MRRIKALLTTNATGIAAMAVMAAVPAVTASAASIPQCTSSKVIQNMILPVNSGSDNCELGTFSGSTHKTAVMVLQGAMNVCFGRSVLGSVYPLSVDGIFGPNTETALRRVQSHIGVASDGEYGPITRTHMSWENGNTGTPCIFDGGV